MSLTAEGAVLDHLSDQGQELLVVHGGLRSSLGHRRTPRARRSAGIHRGAGRAQHPTHHGQGRIQLSAHFGRFLGGI
jgi:hypothetical protein